jgi:hypothetical protein
MHNSVAIATAFASSFCFRSGRYSSVMDLDSIQKYRRERIKAAAEKAGGNAALGRLLGYADGAFVGQMIRGERPISEKTVSVLESKHDFRQWFSAGEQAPNSDEILPLAADEIDMVSAYRLLDAADKTEFYAHLRQMVISKHGPTLRMMERMKLTTRADDASVEQALANVPKSPARRERVPTKAHILGLSEFTTGQTQKKHKAKKEA